MTKTPFRELPPPAAMTLSQSSQQSHSTVSRSHFNQSLEQFPDLPPQWHGAEEYMGNWLLAKAEEDKRKQEEEKTRQEALRLEQRKVEQDMLNTSLREGIPPFLIPTFFAGISGGSLTSAQLEQNQNQFGQLNNLYQQHQALLQQSHLITQSQVSLKQHQRRDSRSSQHLVCPVLQPLTSNHCSKQMTTNGSHLSSRITKSSHLSPAATSRTHQLSHSKGSKLSRVNGEGTHYDSFSVTSGIRDTSEKHSSPPIHFHHWQPPTIHAGKHGSHQQITSYGKCGTSPDFAFIQPSPDHDSSPKKRKTIRNQPSETSATQQQRYTQSPFSQFDDSIFHPSKKDQSHTRQLNHSSVQDIGGDYNEPTNHYSNDDVTSRDIDTSTTYQIISTSNKKPSVGSQVQSTHSVSNLLDILEPAQKNG